MHKDRVLEQLLKEKGLTPSVPSESGNGAGTVLLTGCTGFLGRHILLELLNSDLCDRVYCHVRGRDEGVWVCTCMCVCECASVGGCLYQLMVSFVCLQFSHIIHLPTLLAPLPQLRQELACCLLFRCPL